MHRIMGWVATEFTGSLSDDDISSCYFTFDPDQCTFPDNNATGAGIAFCQNMSSDFTGDSCLSKFQTLDNSMVEFLCTIYDRYNPFSTIVECPFIKAPNPNPVYAFAEGSTQDNFCSTPIAACTRETIENDKVYYEMCMVGSRFGNPQPYQFFGDLCSSFPDMKSTIEGRESYHRMIGQYLPKRWQ